MERRYLVAALAIIATFAVFSRGFRSLDRISFVHGRHLGAKAEMVRAGAMAKAECKARSAAHAVARLRTHLRPAIPEEAQLLAEMNLPMPETEASIAESMARQDAAVAQCARARAMQEAERAQREAARVQERMARAAEEAYRRPIALEQKHQWELDQRIQVKTAALATRMAANTLKLQMATAKLNNLSIRTEMPVIHVDVRDEGDAVIAPHVVTHVHCKVITPKIKAIPEAVRQSDDGDDSR